MTFRQFAFKNVQRNTRTYASFFLSSIFSIIIFFVYAALAFHPAAEIETIATLMRGAEYVIYIFSFLFVLYSMGSFIRARKKELGVLSILGISSRQLNQLLFFENMIIGLVSIVAGITLGLILTKFFFMLCAKVIDIDIPTFYFPVKAIGITGGAFFLLFIIVSLLTPFLIRRSNVLSLLHANKKPNKEPKTSLLLTLLAIGSLGYAYHTLLVTKIYALDQNQFFLNLILGMIGTYFLFTQLSVFLIHWLKKRKKIYWKGTRFLWLSDLSYHIRDNARLFFLICIISSIAFSSFSAVVTYKKYFNEQFESSPFRYAYTSDKPVTNFQKKIEQKLNQANIHYKAIPIHLIDVPYESEALDGTLMKLSEYNHLAHIQGWEIEKLEGNEAIRLTYQDPKHTGPVLLKPNIKVKKTQPISLQAFLYDYTYVVTDQFFNKVSKQDDVKSRIEVGYIIPEWDKVIPKRKSVEIQIGKELTDEFTSARYTKEREHSFFFHSRGVDHLFNLQSINSMLFVGLFMAILFFLAAAGFLYLRLYTGFEQKQGQYRSLSKLGLTEKEVKKSITTQLLILFFLPFTVAVIHSLVGLNALSEYTSGKIMYQSEIIGIGSFLILEIIYFVIIRHHYLKKMKQILV